MKLILSALALMLLVTVSTQAQDTKTTTKVTVEKTDAAKKLVCPVTGEDADPEVSYAYKGTTYYFCCGGCVKRFKADPAKYIKNSAKSDFEPCDHPEDQKPAHEADGHEGHSHSHEGHAHEAVKVDQASNVPVVNTDKKLASKIVNTVCPVMNEEIDPEVPTVTYKGKVYGFCCKPCIKKFTADPEKYLKQS